MLVYFSPHPLPYTVCWLINYQQCELLSRKYTVHYTLSVTSYHVHLPLTTCTYTYTYVLVLAYQHLNLNLSLCLMLMLIFMILIQKVG